MKGRLVIEYSDDCQRIDYQFEEEYSQKSDCDYVLWITLPRGRDIDTAKIKLGLNKYLLRKLNGKTYQRDFPERVEMLRLAYSEGIDLFENCSKVEIKGRQSENLGELAQRKDKVFVIKDGTHQLSMEEVKRLEKEYAGMSNVYFSVEENDELVSLEEYRKTTEMITEVVNKIKGYGLSPLEAAIYAYDYSRDKIYVEEDEEKEAATTSRDLTNVLLRDKIVCVGYARIFKTILSKLGINASVYSISNMEGGHAIVVARLTDEKYDIDGIYYFDPTRDRKLDNTDNHYNTYSAFATTRGAMLNYSCYADRTFGPFDYEEYQRVIRVIQNGEPYNTYLDNTYTYINNISDFLDGKSIYNSKDKHSWGVQYIKSTPDIADKVDRCYELLGQEIDPKKKLEALARVRKVQYYENSEKYPFSSATMRKISQKSDIYYSDYYCTSRPIEEMLRETSDEYDREAKGIDLVKVLRKVRDKKISATK